MDDIRKQLMDSICMKRMELRKVADELGITTTTLRSFIKGRKNPTMITLHKIEMYLEKDKDEQYRNYTLGNK